MTDIDLNNQRMTKEEFLSEIREAFDFGQKTAVVDIDRLSEQLAELCLCVQTETETRVRSEMLRYSLN